VNLSLLRVIRNVISADSDPTRQALFANLLQSSRAARLAFRLHEPIRGRWASALLVSGYGLASFFSIAPASSARVRVLSYAKHANARRQVAQVGAWLGAGQWAPVRSGVRAMLHPSGLSALPALLRRGQLLRCLRIIRTIDARHGFLVSCRVAGAIGWYARARMLLDRHRPGAILVSSDSQPEEMGFVAAGAALGIPQVFASHAHPTPLSPPLNFSLSILEGEAEVEARRRKGPIRGAVILAGIDTESRPMDAARIRRQEPVIGIFAPKAVAWPVLRAIIDDCLSHHHARRVVIRWHPSMLESPHLGDVVADRSRITESRRDARLADVARQCDWVIADENSNVHLAVLKLGIPTVCVRLGIYPESRADQYGFVAARIVPPPVRSLRDVDAAATIAFFSGEWATRFARYDASYLRPAGAVAGDVRRAVLGLFE
jgi:hypothetical protein